MAGISVTVSKEGVHLSGAEEALESWYLGIHSICVEEDVSIL